MDLPPAGARPPRHPGVLRSNTRRGMKESSPESSQAQDIRRSNTRRRLKETTTEEEHAQQTFIRRSGTNRGLRESGDSGLGEIEGVARRQEGSQQLKQQTLSVAGGATAGAYAMPAAGSPSMLRRGPNLQRRGTRRNLRESEAESSLLSEGE